MPFKIQNSICIVVFLLIQNILCYSFNVTNSKQNADTLKKIETIDANGYTKYAVHLDKYGREILMENFQYDMFIYSMYEKNSVSVRITILDHQLITEKRVFIDSLNIVELRKYASDNLYGLDTLYDEKLLQRLQNLDISSLLNNKKYTLSHIFKYDDINLKESIIFTKGDTDIINKYTYKNGNKTEVNIIRFDTFGNSKNQFFYNKYNQIIQELYINKGNDTSYNKKYYYKKQLLVSTAGVHNGKETLYEKYVYKNKRLITRIDYDNNKPLWIDTYHYRKSGKIDKITCNNGDVTYYRYY